MALRSNNQEMVARPSPRSSRRALSCCCTRAPARRRSCGRWRRTGAVRGVDILRAAQPEGPWLTALHVNFFGGFAVDADTGALWVGDEGGGVYHWVDGGDSFENVAPKAAVACLVHARGTLWACTPGTAQSQRCRCGANRRASSPSSRLPRSIT